MSLSKVFKGQGDFKPEQLVPRPPPNDVSWQAVTIPAVEGSPSANNSTARPPAFVAGRGLSGSEGIESADPSRTAQSQDDQDATRSSSDADPEKPAEHPDEIHPPVDIESIKQGAYQAGIEQGLQQAESDFGSSMVALHHACEQLSTIRNTILKNSKDEILELVFALAEKVIRHSVTEQGNTIFATIEEALGQAVRSSEFCVYLNPQDVAPIKERAPELISSLNGLDNIVVKADSAVERGGCRIESENCTIDATIASQLEIIKERIMEDM